MNVKIAGGAGPYVTAAIVAAIAAVVAEQQAAAVSVRGSDIADSWTPAVRDWNTDPDVGWSGLKHSPSDAGSLSI
jgi:hypothetical protein